MNGGCDDNRRLNFRDLIQINPLLSEFYNPKTGYFNFHSNNAIIQLTRALMRSRLDIELTLSRDRLCPTFFNRLDYTLFMKKLLAATCDHRQSYIGLDVGTGQSAIYALMCISLIPDVSKMIGTDIDSDAISLAKQNVNCNKLDDRIQIELVEESANTFSKLGNLLGDGTVGFTMCNPPFYSSYDEMKQKNAFKEHKDLVTGSARELVVKGGELAFIEKMLADSKAFSSRSRVRWFSSLIGNYNTVQIIVTKLKTNPDFNYGVYEFRSGLSTHSTKRWIIYWTFQLTRPPISLFKTKLVSPKFQYLFKHNPNKPGESMKRLLCILRDIATLKIVKSSGSVAICVPGNCWSRSFRRKVKRGESVSTEKYWFEIRVRDEVTWEILWKYGSHYKVFESFCGWLKRKLLSNKAI